MSTALVTPGAHAPAQDYVTIRVGAQHCALPVAQLRDVMQAPTITTVPGAPDTVAGVLNLRGRVVAVLDLHRRLGLPPSDDPQMAMLVMVDHGDEPVALRVDAVGEVLSLVAAAVPMNVTGPLREVATGACLHDGAWIILLDTARILP
ncbi:MAG: chemotaxis protein CheW [Pseudomonadota bacterium]